MMEAIILNAIVEAISCSPVLYCIAIIIAMEPTGIAIVNTTSFICSMLKPIFNKMR